jgi:protein-L-isoaspartate(D-aspartate) O-methyltransferase
MGEQHHTGPGGDEQQEHGRNPVRGRRTPCGAAAALVLGLLACTAPADTVVDASSGVRNASAQPPSDRESDRMLMVERQLIARDITDPRVIDVMQRVPRHRFVPQDLRARAYDDRPLPIGYAQTISQPYVVAYMTQALQLAPDARVLEIGTGSAYQTAVLAELAATVHSIEIVPPLADRAAATLAEMGYDNVHVREGDGYAGWPEAAPFDAIMVTAAPDHVPQPLVDQLAVGGRMIIPVGAHRQTLTVLVRTDEGVTEEATLPVLFVPMTGEAERR